MCRRHLQDADSHWPYPERIFSQARKKTLPVRKEVIPKTFLRHLTALEKARSESRSGMTGRLSDAEAGGKPKNVGESSSNARSVGQRFLAMPTLLVRRRRLSSQPATKILCSMLAARGLCIFFTTSQVVVEQKCAQQRCTRYCNVRFAEKFAFAQRCLDLATRCSTATSEKNFASKSVRVMLGYANATFFSFAMAQCSAYEPFLVFRTRILNRWALSSLR